VVRILAHGKDFLFPKTVQTGTGRGRRRGGSFTLLFNVYQGSLWSQDTSVGIATRYGLDGPEIESRWGGEIFLTCPDRPTQPPIHWVKRPGRGVDHLPAI